MSMSKTTTKVLSTAARVGYSLLMTLLKSILLVALALIYFTITLFVIKTGAAFLGYTLDGNWAVLSAALLTLGSLVGTAGKELIE